MIKEEARLVGLAADMLHRGDAAGALAQLEQIQARFPGGALGQERETLAIEALARSGRRAEASARASAFLRAHPTSTFADRVQPFVR
jgi:outer membrane protein assembly factor BamD (BamD/ComL family)